MSKKTPNNHSLARPLPAGVVRGIEDVAANRGLSFREAAFVCLRALCLSSTDSYLWLRPELKRESARVQGCRWNARLRPHIEALQGNVGGSITALSDLTVVKAMLSGNLDEALRGADLRNRVVGRYRDSPTVQVNVQAILSRGLERPELVIDPPEDLHTPRDERAEAADG